MTEQLLKAVSVKQNNKKALRAVIQLAFFCYTDHYLKMEELPAGRGYADIVYLPNLGYRVKLGLIVFPL